MAKIKLLQRVKDTLTGYEGVVVARTEWAYGCVRLSVQGDLDKDGKVPEPAVFDEPQLKVIKKTKTKSTKSKHGFREAVQRRPAVVR